MDNQYGTGIELKLTFVLYACITRQFISCLITHMLSLYTQYFLLDLLLVFSNIVVLIRSVETFRFKYVCYNMLFNNTF